ncbi:ODV-E66 [Callinectes sapidus nudivirus]|nr:ODV-E66 [Callinectes sapidus nudivirus]
MIGTQNGPKSAGTSIFLFVALLLVMVCLVYLTFHTQQPYVWIVDYVYKSNYYKEFNLPEGYDVETQGRNWCNWDTNEKGISQMCDLFNSSAGYMNTKKNAKAKYGLKLWEEWIVAFLTELEKSDAVNPNFQGFPWGNNWYEFTISSTTNMAYYIVNKHSSIAVKKAAAKAIQYIIVDPQHSLGYERDKANSAMMLFPWTLSHMITETLDTSNKAYIYAVNQYDLTPDQTIRANEDGVHLDYSYLTHGGVYAYGYLWSIYNIYYDTKQVIPDVGFFDLDYHMDKIYSKLRHPKVDTAGCALWHRAFKLNGAGFYTGKTKTRNCEVVPSMRYMRYFDTVLNFHWSARTMQTSVAYYESDHTVDNMGLYAALSRRIYIENDDPVPKFPDIGFIYPKGTTELIRTPSTTATTTPFFCELKDTSKSFVWTDGVEFAVLFQYQMKLPPMLPEMFTEVLCIYLKEHRIETHYRLEAKDLSIFLDKEWTREEGNEVDEVEGYIIFETDLKTRTYKSYLGERSKLLPTVNDFTNGKYRERHVNVGGKTSAFFIDKKVNGTWELFSYTPAEEDVLTETMIVEGYTFRLDPRLNQYQYVK